MEESSWPSKCLTFKVGGTLAIVDNLQKQVK